MAFTARHAETDDLHNVALADPEAEYRCLDCDEELSYVRQHLRTLPSGGTTAVTAHFSHQGGGGGSACGGGGGGETDIHKRRKRDALQEAVNRFDAADYGTEVYIGDKRADALLEFEEPHSEYGKGLVIEYQHKNEGKDIAATEQHFAKNEYTTVWLWEDQYTYDSEIPEIDFFSGRVYTPWPDAVPPADTWRGRGLDAEKRAEWETAHDRGLTDAVVEATVVRHWVIQTPKEYWESEPWDARFRYADRTPEEQYRTQCAIRNGNTLRVEATVPAHWYLPTPKEHWESEPWDARFPDSQPDRNGGQTPTKMLIKSVRTHATSAAKTIPVTLPPETNDRLNAKYSAVNDDERCPRCGRKAEVREGYKWAVIKSCPQGHWSHQSGYKGSTPLGPYDG